MNLQDFTYSPHPLPRDRRFHLLKIQEHASAISRQLGNTYYRQTPTVKPIPEIPLWNDPVHRANVSDTTSWYGSRFEVDTNGVTVDHDHLPQDYKPPKTRYSSSSQPIDWTAINTDFGGKKTNNFYQVERTPIYRVPAIQPDSLTIQEHLNTIQDHAQKALGFETTSPIQQDSSGCGTLIAFIVGILLLAGLFGQPSTEQPQKHQEQGYFIDIPELIQFA